MSAENINSTTTQSEITLRAALKIADKLGFKDTSVSSPHLLTWKMMAHLMRLIEAMLILTAGILAWSYTQISQEASLNSAYIALIIFLSVAAPFSFNSIGLYRMEILRSKSKYLSRLLAGTGLIFGTMMLVFFVLGSVGLQDRLFLTAWVGLVIVSLLLTRFFSAGLLQRLVNEKKLQQRAVIIGGGKSAEDVIAALKNAEHAGFEIVGIFDDRDDERSPKNVKGLKKLGSLDDLISFAREVRIDLLIVTLPLTAESRLLTMLKKLWVLPVDIRLAGQVNKLRFTPKAYSYIGNVPFLDVFDRPLSEWNHLIKNIEDRVIAAIALILLSPVMIVTALLIKLDSKGPVFFKQDRFGFNNNLIGVYKFRSMYTDMADVKADKLVTKDDPRVTKIGRFIRKTSIDELPQLFNVLRGELSLVGPRPHAVSAKAANQLYFDVVDGYFARHKMKPGITGWAQVSGWRGETDTEEKIRRRVDCDLHYIDNWSIWFDLYILAITPYSLLNTENAY